MSSTTPSSVRGIGSSEATDELEEIERSLRQDVFVEVDGPHRIEERIGIEEGKKADLLAVVAQPRRDLMRNEAAHRPADEVVRALRLHTLDVTDEGLGNRLDRTGGLVAGNEGGILQPEDRP